MIRRASLTLTLLACLLAGGSSPAPAQFRTHYTNLPSVGAGRRAVQRAQAGRGRAPAQQRGPAGVYPEFRSAHGVIHWLKEQMPLKVWVSDGLAIDAILDPQLGAPYANTKDVAKWPDLVAHILDHPEKLQALPVAEGYSPQHKQAALAGINSWKPIEKEGYFSYVLTDDPMEADIHLFWVNHFVDQRGMALFQNDIRGYTSKRSFPYKMIMQGRQMPFKPVVIILSTTDRQGQLSVAKMKAAAAHEFGHALGIEGHSSNPADLMSIYYGNGSISPNDAATVRYLYKLTPDLVP
ncbi:MAG: matrixin family metalloprotease [Candidatus Obscuribacterales bacterium]